MAKKLVLNISEDLHIRFKIFCIQKKITMENQIAILVEKLLEGELKEAKQ
jgi:hypothetical protein